MTSFRDPGVKKAVKNLMVYSLTVLLVPLASMFFLKTYFFEGNNTNIILLTRFMMLLQLVIFSYSRIPQWNCHDVLCRDCRDSCPRRSRLLAGRCLF